jgi:hypothetical protein
MSRKLAAGITLSVLSLTLSGLSHAAAATAPLAGGLRKAWAISPSDVWAVGRYFDGTLDRTLTMHWDGTAWTMVPSPSPSNGSDYLGGVTGITSSDVWAVGDQNNSKLKEDSGSSLIEHYDGRTWSVVPSPNPGTGHTILRAVAGSAANDVWAVGFYKPDPSSTDRTLVLHWDGSSWKVVSSPSVGEGGNFLDALTVVSPNDIWAVGTYIKPDVGNRSLTEHWDGSSWKVVPSPNPGPTGLSYPHGVYLYGVSAVAANDIWAAGYYYDGSIDETLTTHWDGTAWTVVPSPSPGVHGNWFKRNTTTSTSDAWAVGWYTDASGTNETLTEHWDGTAWSEVDSPNVPGTSDSLAGATSTSANDVWAVGFYEQSGTNYILTEHWDGSSWTIGPNPITPPGAPTLSASSGSNVVHLAWTTPSDGGSSIAGYRIYRGTVTGKESLLGTVDATVTSYDDTAVSNGTTYYYKVSAVNGVGEGPQSNEVSSTPATVPGAPSLSASPASGKGVILSWTSPPSGGSAITGYRIYRSTSAGGEGFLTSVGNVTSYKDTSTKKGLVYYYKVSAVNAIGEGSLSNEASAKAT